METLLEIIDFWSTIDLVEEQKLEAIFWEEENKKRPVYRASHYIGREVKFAAMFEEWLQKHRTSQSAWGARDYDYRGAIELHRSIHTHVPEYFMTYEIIGELEKLVNTFEVTDLLMALSPEITPHRGRLGLFICEIVAWEPHYDPEVPITNLLFDLMCEEGFDKYLRVICKKLNIVYSRDSFRLVFSSNAPFPGEAIYCCQFHPRLYLEVLGARLSQPQVIKLTKLTPTL